MSPRRTSSGDLCFDRWFRGVGRIQKSAGTKKLTEFRQRDALLTRLYRKPRLDLLQAFRDDRLSIAELVEADRLDQLGQVAADLVLRRPLWTAIEELLPRMGRSAGTRRRYRFSLEKLASSGVLPKGARIADLAGVDWSAVRDRWASSPADWNHLGRALSHFLTVALGDVYHPFARAVRKKFPRRRERHRVPDVTPADFRAIVAKAPRELQAAYWTIVLTLLRPPGELLALRRADLLARTHQVRIRATKTDTDAGDRLVPVAARLWPWIEAAVPVTVTEWQLRWSWNKACKAAGRPGIRLYDLRHVGAQLLADAGRSQAAVGRMLGHAAGSKMTGIYTDRVLREEDAEALAAVLVPHTVPHKGRRGKRHA